jgi:hypothetical protein
MTVSFKSDHVPQEIILIKPRQHLCYTGGEVRRQCLRSIHPEIAELHLTRFGLALRSRRPGYSLKSYMLDQIQLLPHICSGNDGEV